LSYIENALNNFLILLDDLKMKDLYKDITLGLLFLMGILGFVSGEFIISSTLFATEAILSNVHVKTLKKPRSPNYHANKDLLHHLKGFQGHALEAFYQIKYL
jgi:hypothetical protein